MPSRPGSKTDECIRLRKSGLTYEAIAKQLGIRPQTARRACIRAGMGSPISIEKATVIRRALALGASNKEAALVAGVKPDSVSSVVMHDNALAMERPQHELHQEKLAHQRQWSGASRGLLLFDLHCPKMYAPALDAALKAEGSFDWAILGGDQLDQYQLSRFRKMSEIEIADELKTVAEVEQRILGKVPVLYEIMGNHDDRLQKMLVGQLEVLMANLMKEPKRIMLDAVRDVVRWHYERDERKRVHYDWWLPFGNMDRPNVVAHPDRYQANQLGTVKAVRRYFGSRQMDIQSLCIGHLHRMAPWTLDERCWVSEMPALCQRQSYMNASKAYGGALHTGYGILALDARGNFVPNESRAWFCAAL